MKDKIVGHFDEIIKNIQDYLAKFDDHIKAMDAEKTKILDAKKQAEDKLNELIEIRAYLVKRLKDKE